MASLFPGSVGRVDFGDIAAGELYDGRVPLIGRIGRDQDRDSGCLGLDQSIREVRDLISCDFSSVGIGKVAVRHEHRQLAESRFDPDTPIGVGRSPDLDARRVRVVGDDFAL